jgi:hypothetical protein
MAGPVRAPESRRSRRPPQNMNRKKKSDNNAMIPTIVTASVITSTS